MKPKRGILLIQGGGVLVVPDTILSDQPGNWVSEGEVAVYQETSLRRRNEERALRASEARAEAALRSAAAAERSADAAEHQARAIEEAAAAHHRLARATEGVAAATQNLATNVRYTDFPGATS